MEQEQLKPFIEAAEQKAKELSTDCKVHPVVFAPLNGEDKPVIGFIKEPSRLIKMRMMDKALVTPYSVGAECLEACLIKDQSDPRLQSERQEDDAYYMGAVQFCNNLVQHALNQVDKKK